MWAVQTGEMSVIAVRGSLKRSKAEPPVERHPLASASCPADRCDAAYLETSRPVDDVAVWQVVRSVLALQRP